MQHEPDSACNSAASTGCPAVVVATVAAIGVLPHGEQLDQRSQIDVSAGDDADDLLSALTARQRAGHRRGARSFGDDSRPLDEHAYCPCDVTEGGDERSVDKGLEYRPHL